VITFIYLFIPNELLVGKKLHPLIEFLLFWDKLIHYIYNEVKLVSYLLFFILL